MFGDPTTWGDPDTATVADTTRYGSATAMAWDRLHPILTHRAAWHDFPGDLPFIEGTAIRLQVDHLPSGGDPKPLWLSWSGTDATEHDVDRLWQAFLRRFDLEHTSAGPSPGLCAPHAAATWTLLILAVHTRLRLARGLVQDLRRPWEKPLQAAELTPARVRRGFGTCAPRRRRLPVCPNPPGPVTDDLPGTEPRRTT
ncbi:hypothetical protein EDD27_3488 [Nonomuraea polychroma]|uniref:Uncharacterized protein n=1 Tax=Nonomuraea polychroma TaxID=46176 RepID=A0A438M5B0_9ACTN|nr:hypothetical protein [Nonomuraea polychroma]RVX41034.1 hypothetical protein EDD27_3488 [Nonomuraea polychroma]